MDSQRNGSNPGFDYRGWGKVILELAVLLIGMAFWFSRLENRVNRTNEWMMHHIEAEHKERAVMHHRRMSDANCYECKGTTAPQDYQKLPSFN